MKIRTKLMGLFLAVGILPALLVGYSGWKGTKQIQVAAGHQLQSVAIDTLDKVERNLFERYGDVQAFGYNTVAHDPENWYEVGEANPVGQAMNRYVKAYGMYYLTVLVDLEGRVAAVNTCDAAGKAIDTEKVYTMNFKGAPWFRDSLEGRFLTSSLLSGTVVEDVHVDPLIEEIYGDEGLCMGFSAPVADSSGKIVGVWKNYAKWSLVEDVVSAESECLKAIGLTGAELTILDRDGRVIVDCDPTGNGRVINRNMKDVILKLNLADKGVSAAAMAVRGENGSTETTHTRKGITQTSGYAHSAGALGYPGMGWSLLVRVPTSVTSAAMNNAQKQMGLIMLGATAGVLFIGAFSTAMIVKPIKVVVDRLRDIAAGEGDLTKAIDLNRSDEIGQLADGFNTFIKKLRDVIHDVKGSASEVASVATEIAAAAEEMSSAVGEVAQQTMKVSSTAQESGTLAQHGRDIVEKTVGGMDDINVTVRESSECIGQLGTRGEQIGQVISVINDIADQTNLLALNAAIEAARAGEHGRGFAVVADEVRKLAERTTKATEEIGDSIKAIQTETKTAVERMSCGQEQVQRGVELAASAGQSLQEIVNGATNVAGMIHAISAAAEEAGAGARESASAATQLSAKAEQLQLSMSKFRT